jgi:Fur family ferric uptake transcriptional regulator
MDRDPEAVLAQLRDRGHRMTPQRRAIVGEVMSQAGHISAQEIARKVEEKVPGVNASTVYRTLALLEEVGVVSHAHLETGPEYHLTGHHDHVHLVCSRCKKTMSLSVEELAAEARSIEKRIGFAPEFSHFAIAGLCADCGAR